MRKIFVLNFFAFLFFLALPAIAETTGNPPVGWLQGRHGMAPSDAEYFTLSVNSGLSSERVLTFSTPQFSTSDNGAGNTYVVGLGPILSYWYGTGATTNQEALNALTNIAGRASGDIFYWNGTNFTRLPIGSVADVLTVSGSNLPSWSASASGAPQAAHYVTTQTDGTLTNEHVISGGDGVDATVGAGTCDIAVDSTVIRTTGAQAMSGPKTLSGGPIISGANSTGLVLRGSSFDTTVLTDPAANQSVTIPAVGTSNFVMTAGAQTIGGVKTLSSSPVLSTDTITGSGANTVTLFTSSDTVVGRNTSDVMTNKELTSPSLTNNATGLTMKGSGSNTFVHTWSPGATGQTITWSNPNGNVDVAYKTGAAAAGGFAYGIGNNTLSITGAGTTGQVPVSAGASAPAWGVAPIPGGGTNNGSLGVSALGIYNGDGSKIVQTTAAAGQSWRVNSGGTAVEAFTPGTGTVTSVAQSLTGLGFLSISGSPVTTSGTLALAGSGSTGDTIYFSSANTTSKLTIGSSGTVYRSTGSIPGWVNPSATKRKAADTSRTSTTTVTDDPDLLFAVAANEVRDFTAHLIFQSTSATPDLKFTCAGPSGSTVTYAGQWFSNGTSTIIPATSGGTTTACDVGGNQISTVTISGTCTNGATPGNLSIQWAQNTSNATAMILYAGSYLDNDLR